MKKTINISALLLAGVGFASGQSFIAGLDFKDPEQFQTNKAFDLGTEKGSFTLNIQSDADDNLVFSGVATDPGWSASNDLWSDGTNTAPAGSSGIPITVQNSSAGGATASTDPFGNTSAFAQGFSSTHAIAFGQNDAGFFTIGVGAGSLGSGFENVSLNFDVGALGSESQTVGLLDVAGTQINVTSVFSNQTVNLGNLAAGSLITFDLTGLSNGATFDNFMISGTAVPEPSAFAAIAGALALGLAVSRRRKSA